MIIKKTIIILLLISGLCVSAQIPSNEFSVYGGGGFSFFHLQPAIHDASSSGFSGDFGIGYTYFFNRQCGIHIGAGFGLYNVICKVPKIEIVTSGLFDKNNYIYNLHTTLSDYRETYKSMFLNVPLMIQYQTKRDKKDKKGLYATGGIKVLILPKTKYKAAVATLFNAAYYPEMDNWAATQSFVGLGLFDGNSATGNLGFDVLTVFTIETGIKQRISDNNLLYIGVYFDYCFNNFSKKNREMPNNYTAAEHLTELTLLKFTDKMNITTVGIKLRLTLQRKKGKYDC